MASRHEQYQHAYRLDLGPFFASEAGGNALPRTMPVNEWRGRYTEPGFGRGEKKVDEDFATVIGLSQREAFWPPRRKITADYNMNEVDEALNRSLRRSSFNE